jgi:hypothetical protein
MCVSGKTTNDVHQTHEKFGIDIEEKVMSNAIFEKRTPTTIAEIGTISSACTTYYQNPLSPLMEE